jgi:hypothetical protein
MNHFAISLISYSKIGSGDQVYELYLGDKRFKPKPKLKLPSVFSWCSPVFPNKCLDNIFKLVTTAFHIRNYWQLC